MRINDTEVWNTVSDFLLDSSFPNENERINKGILLHSYYNEIESGGHEGFLRWCSDYIQQVGSSDYFNQLINGLNEISAHPYAELENNYIRKLWSLYLALEKQEITEDTFCEVVREADKIYYQLNDDIRDKLVIYYTTLYKDIIE